jgi:hypothetical protein
VVPRPDRDHQYLKVLGEVSYGTEPWHGNRHEPMPRPTCRALAGVLPLLSRRSAILIAPTD